MLRVQGGSVESAKSAAQRLVDRSQALIAQQAAYAHNLQVLGPAEAPIAVVRGRHRFRLLVRAPRNADLQGFLCAMLATAPQERGSVRVAVDVDPQNFM